MNLMFCLVGVGLNDLPTGNYDLFEGNLTRNGQRHRVPCPAFERRRWRVLNREGFLQAQGDLNLFFQGFLALSKSFASMKWSWSFLFMLLCLPLLIDINWFSFQPIL